MGTNKETLMKNGRRLLERKIKKDWLRFLSPGLNALWHVLISGNANHQAQTA